MHDDGQDQTGIDLGFPGDLEDRIVDGTLLGATVVVDHREPLVKVEHGAEVHPLVERGEVLLDAAIADIVAAVGEAVVSNGDTGVVPFETVTSNHRPDAAESKGLEIRHTGGGLRTLARVGSGEIGSDRAGNCKSHERRNSENLEVVS